MVLALTAGTAAVQFDSKENDLTGHAAVLDVALASRGLRGLRDRLGLPALPARLVLQGLRGLRAIRVRPDLPGRLDLRGCRG